MWSTFEVYVVKLSYRRLLVLTQSSEINFQHLSPVLQYLFNTSDYIPKEIYLIFYYSILVYNLLVYFYQITILYFYSLLISDMHWFVVSALFSSTIRIRLQNGSWSLPEELYPSSGTYWDDGKCLVHSCFNY